MELTFLGRSGLKISRLIFGTLPLGPLQGNYPVEYGAELMRKGFDLGINILDTAESYGTYPHIREALRGRSDEVYIATKSTAPDFAGMEASVHKALREMGREYIDIFHMHAARTRIPFKERQGALECLIRCKEKGLVRNIGISTHSVKAVRDAAMVDEIDVIHPLINREGMGIIDGKAHDMMEAIALATSRDKGIYAMKALAGGYFMKDAWNALDYIRSSPNIHGVAVGMVTYEELEANAKFFSSQRIPVGSMTPLEKQDKNLIILEFCKGCGTCVKACPSGALTLENGKAVVDTKVCILCGYCNPVCPEFAIRIV